MTSQGVLELEPKVFALIRKNIENQETIYVLMNVSIEDVTLNVNNLKGMDLLSGTQIQSMITLNELQAMWIRSEHKL